MKRLSNIFLLFLLLCLIASQTSAEVIKGTVEVHSRRASMFVLNTIKEPIVVSYSEDTGFLNLKDDSELEKDMYLTVKGQMEGVVFYAGSIEAMPLFRKPQVVSINLNEFEDRLRDGVKVVDLRKDREYRRGHIPGAIHYSELKENGEFIFYCYSKRCDSGENVAFLDQLKDSKKYFFADGVKGWIENKRPLEITSDRLSELMESKEPYVLLDIRNREEISRGFIPGAVSIPDTLVPYSGYRFPSYRKARIIVYGHNKNDLRAERSAITISSWGYSNTFILKEGFQGYKERGFKVATGRISEDIEYKRTYGENIIPIHKFREYLESLPGDLIIIDVRERDEYEKGHFPGSVNIPLDELPFRLDEIDKKKRIITHCISGVRAKIAYYILTKAGFNVRCLVARVGFDDSGIYSISDI